MDTARDKRITFKEKEHEYWIDKKTKIPLSATGVLGMFFSPFVPHLVYLKNKAGWAGKKDPDYWDSTTNQVKDMETVLAEWTQAAMLGTLLHGCIEHFFTNQGAPDKAARNKIAQDVNTLNPHIPEDLHVQQDSVQQEYNYFKDFYDKELANAVNNGDLIPLKPEQMVWLDTPLLAGSIDMIFRKKSDNTLILYDWKRTKKITETDIYDNKTGIGILSDVPEAKFHTYSLQLNLYKHMLEQHYGETVSEMYFVQFHRKLKQGLLPGGYKCWPAKDYSAKIQPMLDVYKALYAL